MNKVRIVKNILVVVGVLGMGFSGFAGAEDVGAPPKPITKNITDPK